MRILGIDFGEKRVGVAVSDAAGEVATPLVTLARKNDRALIRALQEIVRDEEIEALVVGEPLRLDGTRGDAARRVGAFADRLATACELPYELIDEALTSVEASERLRAAGVDLKRHPERIDSLAAQIILQEALDRDRSRRQP